MDGTTGIPTLLLLCNENESRHAAVDEANNVAATQTTYGPGLAVESSTIEVQMVHRTVTRLG
jgi:hypothetical protein